MFEKILIANRGEIACRIIETARSMGISTVAVYSDSDAKARHVLLADEAVHIGPSAPSASYLNADQIISAARTTGANAIHPGYGFLSENPEFAQAVDAAGITFIGPSPASMRAMGLKGAAKIQMEQAGVPVVPGYHGQNQDDDRLKLKAESIGYPVLIKAVAGGGGKGMRRVDQASEFLEALAGARAEARGAFANDAVLIEKYIEKPRHIEIQVFGDGKTAVHLFERDCSLQRRHQKVIEEAPAPGMTPAMRADMGKAAVDAAIAIGYKGAGTVEFIVDASDGLRADRFWFMEMNTRLQVEHPVTEAVTGIDLVEWQIRVAAGEPIPLTQDKICLNGHSFEARIYAEDVPKGFLPATGIISYLAFPGDIRVDTGVREGDAISTHYDPMIAKITVHGGTREIALSRLKSALNNTKIGGTVTNLGFLSKLANLDAFAAGNVETGLIELHLASLISPDRPPIFVKALAILAAADVDARLNNLTGFSIWGPLRHTIRLADGCDDFQATLLFRSPGEAVVELENGTFTFRKVADKWREDVTGFTGQTIIHENTISVFGDGAWHFDIPDPLETESAEVTGDGVVLAPMPGQVKGVFVSLGQTVVAGQRLAILEAMKMEHTLTAQGKGEVAEILTKVGAQVEARAPLIRLDDVE